MSRFDYDDYDEDGMPYELWERNLSMALGGKRGQAALAEMEAALVALSEPKLIEGHLAAEGGVCAIGALVAHKEAQEQGVDIGAVIETMQVAVRCWCGHSRDAHDGGCTATRRFLPDSEPRPCRCSEFRPEGADPNETAQAGTNAGLKYTVAWHLAYLNDETFRKASPEGRHAQMLAWVRRAQGKTDTDGKDLTDGS